MKNERSDRREFLKGRALARAVRQAVENYEFDVPGLELSDGQARQAAYLESYEKKAMACTWELMFNMRQYRQAAATAGRAMELIDSIESQLTIFREDSEIAAINRLAFADSVETGAGVFELLSRAKGIFERTDGAFDCTAGELSSIWGFEQRQGQAPGEDAIAEALARVGMQHLILNADDRSVQFAVEGLKINLGGIGKGYAIDRVARLFDEAKIGDYIIHGGQSSVFARGAQADLQRPEDQAGHWPVGLSHPTLPDRRLAEFFLRDRALGTSGSGRQGFVHRGKRYGHIIHPKTGWPTDHILSATVISGSAELSDALATAFFVMSIEEVEAFCRQSPEVAAVLVSPSQGKDKSQIQLDWFNLEQGDWKRL